MFGIMSDGSPYQVKWAKRAPLAYQKHTSRGRGVGRRGVTDRQIDGRAHGLLAEHRAPWQHYVTIRQRVTVNRPQKVCYENCGQNSQQILNWFAGEKNKQKTQAREI